MDNNPAAGSQAQARTVIDNAISQASLAAAPAVAGRPATPARMDIARLLEAVVKYDASDLHLAVGRPPVVRVRGDVQPENVMVGEFGETVEEGECSNEE